MLRARAIATRCCWPPESEPGLASIFSESPTFARFASATLFASAFDRRRTFVCAIVVTFLFGSFYPNLILAVAATPLGKHLWDRAGERAHGVLLPVLTLAGLVLCTASLVDASYNPFLYFRF